MKQVFQADDGTIFEKEIDCEKYESKLAYKETLKEGLIAKEYKPDIVDIFIYDLTEMVTQYNMASKLINFIKSIGEQDGNSLN